MRVRWVLALVTVLLLSAPALPSSACVLPPGSQTDFEPQSMGSGSVFLNMTPLVQTLVEELFPYTATFKDRLYVTWQREDFNETVKYFDTVLSYDGTSWSDPLYISSPDMGRMIRSELNLNPRIGASEEALYVVWTSNEPNWTTGVDDDVVMRYTEDGTNWSKVIEVTGHYNLGLDKLARVVPFKGRTWFLWESNDLMDTDGRDMDIVMRSWDGNDFGQVIEVTPAGDSENDHHVDVATDSEHMYITWMKKNYTGGANVHDIWAAVFDGSSWVLPPTKISSDAVADNEHITVVAADGRGIFIWETYDTGKHSDLSAVVLRTWGPGEGLGRRAVVSSLTSNGKDSKPAGLWWDGSLYVTWVTTDQGITFGQDSDLVFRVGTWEDDGRFAFDDIVEVSDSTDDYADRFPSLVVYDDVVNVVWIVDTNYTHLFTPEELVNTSGIFRSPDVVIKSIVIPFEKQLSLTFDLGSGAPSTVKPTYAEITIKDLEGRTVEDLNVKLAYRPSKADLSKTRYMFLEDRGDGLYSTEELEFFRDGPHTVAVVVNDVEVGTFSIDIASPPASFLDRVPTTSLVFLMAAVVTGGAFYRSMGRDELVEELRPAPLGLGGGDAP